MTRPTSTSNSPNPLATSKQQSGSANFNPIPRQYGNKNTKIKKTKIKKQKLKNKPTTFNLNFFFFSKYFIFSCFKRRRSRSKPTRNLFLNSKCSTSFNNSRTKHKPKYLFFCQQHPRVSTTTTTSKFK